MPLPPASSGSCHRHSGGRTAIPGDPGARLADVRHQVGHPALKCLRDLLYGRDGHVTLAALDHAHKGPVQAGNLAQLFLRDASLGTDLPQVCSKSRTNIGQSQVPISLGPTKSVASSFPSRHTMHLQTMSYGNA